MDIIIRDVEEKDGQYKIYNKDGTGGHWYITKESAEQVSGQVEPLVIKKNAEVVKDIMQEGFEIAMGGDMDLSEEANRREQSKRYDRAVKNYTKIITSNFSA